MQTTSTKRIRRHHSCLPNDCRVQFLHTLGCVQLVNFYNQGSVNCCSILKMNCLGYIGDIEKMKPSVTSYTWRVTKNALDLTPNVFVISPLMTTDHADIKCRLILFPQGRGESDSDQISLYIQFFTSNEAITEVTVNVKFVLLNTQNEPVVKHRLTAGKYKLLPEDAYQDRSLPRAVGRDNFAPRNVLTDENNGVLHDDGLKLACEILSYDPIFTIPLRTKESEDQFRLREFDDFKRLLNSEKFSDVTFTVDDRKISAHKVILVSRSAVFRAMFDTDMLENEKNTVDIVDFKYDVVKELLRFMYAGSVDNIDRMACELLLAADKYCVTGLKVLCEERLCGDLSVDNVLERLTVAYMCNSEVLKARAIEFVVKNASEVTEKEEFAALHPELMCEITRGITRSRMNQ